MRKELRSTGKGEEEESREQGNATCCPFPSSSPCVPKPLHLGLEPAAPVLGQHLQPSLSTGCQVQVSEPGPAEGRALSHH